MTTLALRAHGDTNIGKVRDHNEVTVVARRILNALERPIEFDDATLTVGASIGIADTAVGVEGRAALSAAELLRAADTAMYNVKANGGNRFSSVQDVAAA